MSEVASADAVISRLSADLEVEEGRIAAAVNAKSIGDNSGYWKKAHALRERLRVAVALRDALFQVSS